MKNKYKKILIIALCVIVCIVGGVLGCGAIEKYKAYDVDPLKREDVVKLMENCDKLMIVAHPDDETLWGGAHLKAGGYLVVCITRGRDKTRKAEFENVVKKSGNIPLILEYPDKVNLKRDDWKAVRSGIEKDVALLVGVKDWSLIVTHNPEGEYGHQHHIMTSSIVTEATKNKGCYNRLVYMGKYYKKDELEKVSDNLVRLPDEAIKYKEDLLSLYTSQGKTVDKLSHMNPYEMWVGASEWK